MQHFIANFGEQSGGSMLKELILRSAVFASCVCSAGVHAQSLIGSTVEFGGYYPSLSSPITQIVSTTVSDGVEFTNIGSLNLSGWIVFDADIDVSATSIFVDYAGGGITGIGSFNGYIFNFTNLGGQFISGVELDSATTFSPDKIALSFDADSVFLSLPNTLVSPSSVLAVNLQIAPVPEPATASLMLAGGFLLAGAVRRRSKTAPGRIEQHDSLRVEAARA